MNFTVYPAIDVCGGRVVRLRQGDFERETRYVPTPLQVALAHSAQGAHWLHLVDLDGAREGGYALCQLLREIRAASDLRVQTGGGIRTADDVEALLEAGATRVVVGSLAVSEPARVAKWIVLFGADRLAVALDVRLRRGRWQAASHGWTQSGTESVESLVDFYAAAGLRHMLCTDIACDGMLLGPNLALYRKLCARVPTIAVQASGGMRGTPDLAAVRAAGCAGAVLGRTLLDGHLLLREALAC